MSREYKRKHCKICGTKTKHSRKGTSHILHLLLSILSAGVWIPIWILAAIFKDHWQCDTCGG